MASDAQTKSEALSPTLRRAGILPVLAATLGAPTAWALHLGISYTIVWAVCSFDLAGGAIALAASTVVFGGAALASGIYALRRFRGLSGGQPWDELLTMQLEPLAYLMLLGVVLACVFVLLIVWEVLPGLFTPLCLASPGYPNV